MAAADYPRLPAAYSYSTQAAQSNGPITVSLPPADSSIDLQAALRVSCALTLATHAGESVFALAVGSGVSSGTIESTLAELLTAVQHIDNDSQATKPRLRLSWRGAGIDGASADVDRSGGRFSEPLVVWAELGSESGSLRLSLRYDSRLLPELEARWFMSHLASTLTAVLSSADSLDRAVRELQLCRPSQSELDAIAEHSTSGPAASTYPDSCTTLHAFLITTAAQHPDQPALIFDEAALTVTYAQLLSVASHLAQHLLSLGTISPGQVIPLCIDKRPEMIISMLAILLAGCAYVNLEPSWPDGRKETIVREASEHGFLRPAIALVGGEEGCAQWEKWGSTWLKHVIDPIEVAKPWLATIEQLDKVDRSAWPAAREDDPAYLVYTSGSTGAPKGIVVSHGNVSAFLKNYKGVFGRAVGERVLQFPSYAFDVSVVSIWDTFAQGATLCMCNQSTLMSDLAGAVIRLGVTLVDLTPTVSALLLEDPDAQPGEGESLEAAWQRAGLDKLKQINTGGEKVERRIRDAWMARGVRVVIDYGPTETTVGVIANQDISPGIANVPIGRPTGENRVHILAFDSLDPVPLGCVGEICITGAQVTRGYVKQALNRDVFVDHPDHGPLYRTGDLGRFLADGQYSVECLGRRDGQVKVNGLRIEIGEIEQHLSGQPQLGLVRGVVDKLETDKIAATLVACVELSKHFLAKHAGGLPAPGPEPVVLPCSTEPAFLELVEQLKKSVGKHVPGYMVPRYWLAVDRIPTQGMGKTDRKALRALAQSHDFRASRRAEAARAHGTGASGANPRQHMQTESEWHDAARRSWAKVLGMEPGEIGDGDAFTRLGGDSIAFARTVSLLRQAGYPVSFAKLAEAVTLNDCAKALAQIGKPNGGSESEAAIDGPKPFALLDKAAVPELLSQLEESFRLSKADVQDMYPTAPPQDAILAASADSDAYYAQAVYDLDPRVKLETVSAALAQLVRRHDPLRTCFAVLEGADTTLQVVLGPNSKQVKDAVQITQHFDCDDVEAAIDSWLAEDRAQHSPFAWGQLALSFAVFGSARQEKQDRLQLGWSMHHAMSDGFTLELLMADLRAICHGLELPVRPPFSAFARWWQSLPPTPDSTAEFWKTHLAHTEPLAWPSRETLGVDEPLSTTAMRAVEWKGDLKMLATKQGITPAIASRVAIAIALAHRAKKETVTLGIVRSGRDVDLPGADEMIGPCVSVLPSLLELGPAGAGAGERGRGRSVLELMQAEAGADRRARKHQEVTLPQIARWLDLPGRDSLFEVLVTYQSLAQHDDDDDERAPVWPLRQPPKRITMPTGYSLSFEITPRRDHDSELELAVFYDPRVVSEPEVDEVLGWVGRVLDWATVAPCTTLAELELGEPGKSRDKQPKPNPAITGAGMNGDASREKVQRITKEVMAAWATVLKLELDEFGESDSFASLGGDSIRTMRLSVALGRAGLAIPLHSLAQLTTPSSQAKWLAARSGSGR